MVPPLDFDPAALLRERFGFPSFRPGQRVSLTLSRQGSSTQVQATLAVIDDQRAKSATTLGADDRSAGASSGAVADIIASAAVTKLRSRFGS